MKILMVTDQYYSANNGYTISSRRFAAVLRAHGHEVRIASFAAPGDVPAGETAYVMKKLTIPFFDGLICSQGMTFARPDKALLAQAIAWADVVHFVSPFALSHVGIGIARRLGVPYTAAFHVQPENITSSIHLGRVGWVNTAIYRWFRFYIYRYCGHVHCPSNFIAGELRRNGYTSCLHVISNGIDPDFTYRKLPKVPPLQGKFTVLMVGRMSVEKRQDVLIRAVGLSRHASQIQLVLAGQGPRTRYLQKLARSLPNPLILRFFPKPQLLELIAMSDLYVHAADMEIEAMSCMEAFAGGLVPVIANSPKSATPQFALDERSLFTAGDAQDLARKIDYWIENPEERARMEHRYAEHARQYALDACVRQCEQMFAQAIADNGAQRPTPCAESV